MKAGLIALITLGALSAIQPGGAQIIHSEVPVANETEREWTQGWIEVDENRLVPSSNRIKLPFVLSKVPDEDKVCDIPVLIMSGGPGNASLHMTNGVVYTPWGRQADVLVMDQRGTGHSSPCLDCPEVDSLRIEGVKSMAHGRSLDSYTRRGAKLCYDRLSGQNTDLAGYNTLQSLEDIEALRVALGFDKLVLYGMSYSCNLMAAYAQTYPEHTHALILDSPLPHHANYDIEAFANIDATVQNLLRHYGAPEGLYASWTAHIEQIKDSTYVIEVDGSKYAYGANELIDAMLFRMYSHRTLHDVADCMKRIIEGDHRDVIDVIKGNLSTTNQALGMRYSLWVSEELPHENPKSIIAERHETSWLGAYAVNDMNHQLGEVWEVESIYKSADWPESTYDGPTIILSGQFDPWTPTSYGKMMKSVTTNATHKIYPETTHLPGFTEEGFEDIREFIESVTRK